MRQHPSNHHLFYILQRIIDAFAVFQQLSVCADGIKKDVVPDGQAGKYRAQHQIAALQHPFFSQTQKLSQRHLSRLPFLVPFIIPIPENLVKA